MRSIPVSSPDITESDIEEVIQTLRKGWISGESPVVEQFESAFASSCGRKHGITVSNGTAALDVLIHSLNIGPGDEVVLPSFAIISCLSQILRSGATPIFVDVERDTWNMRVSDVADLISDRTRAVMAVHTYGLPVDMDPLIELSLSHGIPIIEDAAESHGLKYKGKPCGSFGIASTFSFYANKNITTGEGGIVVTDDDFLAAKIRYLRNLTFEARRRFVHTELGWNLRMSSVQCALGLSQLKRLDQVVARRRYIGGLYHNKLRGLPGVDLSVERTAFSENDYWVFGIVFKEGGEERRRIAQDRLNSLGIGTRPFFFPLHRQPVLRRFGLDAQAQLPVSEFLGASGFYIPNGLGMSDEDIHYVSDHVRETLEVI